MGQINIEDFIKWNISNYPKSTKLDIYKEIYQAINLTGHMISSDSYDKLINELEDVYSDSIHKDLYDYIDIDVVRINLMNFVFNTNELFNIFKNSSNIKLNKNYDYLLDKYDLNIYNNGLIPSHSGIYKNTYYPHYRICYLEYLPLTYRIYKLSRFIEDIRLNIEQNDFVIICVDGLPFSGKSVICNKLQDVTLLSTEDIDVYYLEKILGNLHLGDNVTINCNNERNNISFSKTINVKNIVIVEGRFSYIDFLRKYYNYLAFCIVSDEIASIRNKNNEYIDEETKEYYSSFDFINKADILI